MELNGRRFKKEEVFLLAKEIKKFLKIIEGTSIEAENEYILKSIESQKKNLERILVNYEPTIYEEYSDKVKIAYNKMISTKNEYNRVVSEQCYDETIEKAKEDYRAAALEYEKVKEYRDRLKKELEKVK